MQDKKIDKILEGHMINDNFNSYPIEAIQIFGLKFITKMSKIYEYKEDLYFRLTEAVSLFKEFYVEDIDENELKQDILFSFRMRPELNSYERLTYLDALLCTKYLYEDIENTEEKIGRKLMIWYEVQTEEVDIELAKAAINDHVLNQMMENHKQKERQKKIS